MNAALAWRMQLLLAGLLSSSLLPGCGMPNEEGIVEEKACADFWSAVHFGSGYYLGEQLGEDRFLETMAILIVYELAEPHFWPGFGENRLNQDCDVVFGALGWAAAVLEKSPLEDSPPSSSARELPSRRTRTARDSFPPARTSGVD